MAVVQRQNCRGTSIAAPLRRSAFLYTHQLVDLAHFDVLEGSNVD